MKPSVAVIGTGLFPFGRHPGVTALEMGAEAIRRAIVDAGVLWSTVDALVVGSLEISNPDSIIASLGLSGIPVRAVFNGCATGNASLSAAAEAIESGAADIAIASGLDKHPRGAFAADPSCVGLPQWYGEAGFFHTTQFFGMKAARYCHDYGISDLTLARVAAKNFRNGAANPDAWRRKALTESEILASPVLNYPLTQYMYCGPDEGAAAVVLCRADKAREYTSKPVYLLATALRSRREGAFELMSPSLPLEEAPGVTEDVSREAYEKAGIGPEDVDVCQLQDTDAGSELIHMAENGFCKHGEQEGLLTEGATEIGGKLPVNTDGGLMANGEPVGASGLRQIHELVTQLLGRGRNRQVPGDPRVGYAHLYGAPGSAGVAILSR